LANASKTPLYLAWHSAFGGAALRCKETMRPLLEKGVPSVFYRISSPSHTALFPHICLSFSAGDRIVSFDVNAKLDVRNYHGGASWVFDPAVSGGGCLIDRSFPFALIATLFDYRMKSTIVPSMLSPLSSAMSAASSPSPYLILAC